MMLRNMHDDDDDDDDDDVDDVDALSKLKGSGFNFSAEYNNLVLLDWWSCLNPENLPRGR